QRRKRASSSGGSFATASAISSTFIWRNIAPFGPCGAAADGCDDRGRECWDSCCNGRRVTCTASCTTREIIKGARQEIHIQTSFLASDAPNAVGAERYKLG